MRSIPIRIALNFCLVLLLSCGGTNNPRPTDPVVVTSKPDNGSSIAMLISSQRLHVSQVGTVTVCLEILRTPPGGGGLVYEVRSDFAIFSQDPLIDTVLSPTSWVDSLRVRQVVAHPVLLVPAQAGSTFASVGAIADVPTGGSPLQGSNVNIIAIDP